MSQRTPFVSNSNIHNLLCWIPNCKYFFCYVDICSPLYLNYSSHISSMTVGITLISVLMLVTVICMPILDYSLK